MRGIFFHPPPILVFTFAYFFFFHIESNFQRIYSSHSPRGGETRNNKLDDYSNLDKSSKGETRYLLHVSLHFHFEARLSVSKIANNQRCDNKFLSVFFKIEIDHSRKKIGRR